MFDKIKGTIEMIKGLDKGTLEGIRWTLIFILILDIGLFYWYMKWKRFGISLLLVLCVMLAIIMILERRFPMEEEEKEVKMVKKKDKIENKDKEPKEKKEESDGLFNVDFGLGTAEEYQDRLSKALG